jgi:hypothetical protein
MNQEIMELAVNFFELEPEGFVLSEAKQKEFLKKAFPKTNWSK